MKNKILFFDIETSPILGYVWQLRETDVLKIVKSWKLLCFSYKWIDSKVKTVSLPQFKNYKKDKEDDSAIVKELWNLFNEADIIIAHNGDKFDIKKSYAKFSEHNLPPPEPFRTVDTLKVARRYFKFDSNRLDALGDYLELGRKIQTGGIELWLEVIAGDKQAWRKMERYNRQDVALLEKVYLKLRPFMNNHPNLSIFNGYSCPICGGKDLQRRGFSISTTGKRQRMQCTDCGGWSLLTNLKDKTTIK